MPIAKSLRCNRCDRTFAMPAHLARHMSAAHGFSPRGRQRIRGRAKARARGRGRRGRPMVVGNSAARRGRPPRVVTRLGLIRLSNDELVQVMDATRSLLQERIRMLQRYLG